MKHSLLIYRTFRYSCLFFIVVAISSCKKFVQIAPPNDELVTQTIFSDSSSATSAVTGMYIAMMSSPSLSLTNGGLSGFAGLSSDELQYLGSDGNLLQFYQNDIPSSGNYYNESSIWQLAYKIIYQANACLGGLNNSANLSQSLISQLQGESKFVRAFLYFNLVNLYGATPFTTSTDYVANAKLPQLSVDSIYLMIESDLNDCQHLLVSTNSEYGNIRPNVNVSNALLARVYLYQKNWSMAYALSNEVIGSGGYEVDPNLNNVFLPSSKEAIWQMPPVIPGRETPEGVTYRPSRGNIIPGYVISSYLLNAFEPLDNRRYQWVDSNIVNGIVYYYPYKYKLGRDGSSSPLEYCTVLRLSEQLLIRSECEAYGMGGGINAAINDLNTIRGRAGLSNYSGANDQGSVLNAIYHERQVELFMEWGHRWYDLKRIGMIDQVMGGDGVCAAKGGTWSGNWAEYPIPFDQIQLNTMLVQNPGYN